MSSENLCSQCKKPVFKPRVNVDPEALHLKLRLESGPTAFEKQEIKDMLALCDKDSEDYEYEIVRLQAQILYMREQQRRLKFHKTKLRSLSSRIRRLPNETLGLIFEYACESNFIQEFPWSLDGTPPTLFKSCPIRKLPALCISAVCSRWRSVSLATPSLWAQLKLEITSCDKSPTVVNPFTDMLSLYLSRSKQCPLDIDLNLLGYSRSTPLALGLLLQHSSRWRTLQYDGDDGIDHHIKSTPFSCLEDIRMDSFTLYPDTLEQYKDIQKLRHLTVSYLDMDPPPTPASVLNKLTHLNVRVQGNFLDRAFTLLPALKSLVLAETDEYEFPLIAANKTVDQLRTLNLQLQYTPYKTGLLDYVLQSFSFPSLAELEIGADMIEYNRSWPKREFNMFLSRSSGPITKLSLWGLTMSCSDLVSTLQLLPSLQDLAIATDADVADQDCPLKPKFISSLNCSTNNKFGKTSSPLVPRLRYLTLKVGGTTFDDAGFVSMVTSRWLPDPQYAAMVRIDCLRSVNLHFYSRTVDNVVYKPLQHLDKMGLMVVVTGEEEYSSGSESESE